MAEEEINGGGAGDGGDEGTPDGAQGEGAGVEGAGEGASADTVAGIPREALPEALRNRQPAEIKMILDHTVNAVRQAADENRRLKEELESSRRGGGSGSSAGGGTSDKPKKALEELIFENPEEAIAQVIETRYGTRLAELDSNVGEAIYDSIRNREPSFAEYEQEVRDALRQGNLPPKREHIMGAFLMAAGQKSLRSNKKSSDEGKKAAGAGSSRSKEEKPDKGPKLTDLDREVAREMRMSEDKYLAAKKKAETGEFGIKVPDGKARKKDD